MGERQGLVGAMPVGERWRAQGCVGGVTRYLGTFDSEEEAHQVFIRARDAAEAERRADAEREIDRILSGPTMEYRGGVGRGAVHNGRRFKVVEARGPHQAVVVPVDMAGVPDFTGQTTVTSAYLYEVPPEPEAKPEAVTVDPVTTDHRLRELEARCQAPPVVESSARSALRESVLRFVRRPARTDIPWAYEFAEKHARPKAAAFFASLSGTSGMQQQLEWLRVNTTVPSDIVDAVEREHIGGLYMNDEAKSAARVLRAAFPESMSADTSDLDVDEDYSFGE